MDHLVETANAYLRHGATAIIGTFRSPDPDAADSEVTRWFGLAQTFCDVYHAFWWLAQLPKRAGEDLLLGLVRARSFRRHDHIE